MCLQQGWVDRARETADALDVLMPEQIPTPMGSFIETWASWCEIKARLDIATGRPDRAAERLRELRTTLSRAGMTYLEARMSLLYAMALQQEHAHEAALAALTDALRYAQPNGMIGSFVDEGEPMLRLLTQLRREAPGRDAVQPAFVDQLLAAFDPRRTPTDDGDVRDARNLLSAREIEILNHIARGMSNKEIGRALRVAPETIKWHLKNIFEKLKVGSRYEAVQSALGVTPAERGKVRKPIPDTHATHRIRDDRKPVSNAVPSGQHPSKTSCMTAMDPDIQDMLRRYREREIDLHQLRVWLDGERTRMDAHSPL